MFTDKTASITFLENNLLSLTKVSVIGETTKLLRGFPFKIVTLSKLSADGAIDKIKE